MPTILDKLLGKRAPSSKNIALEIEAQTAAIDACRVRREEAGAARKAAIENFDDDAHKAADETIAATGRDIERREHALAALRHAYGERVEIEKREAYRREVKEAKVSEAKRAERLKRDYIAAAEVIAACAAESGAASYKLDCLRRRARELGEDQPAYAIFADGLHFAVGDLPSLEGNSLIHTALGAFLSPVGAAS